MPLVCDARVITFKGNYNIMQYIYILLFVCFVQVAHTQIVTDRPDQTESSSTVKSGDLQIESGLLLGFEGEGEQATRQILAPTTLFRYGINQWFELRLLSQFETLKSNGIENQGISDIEIGTKIQLLQNENINTEIAFLSHLVTSSGSAGFRSEQLGTINKLSISHSINENVGIGYNLGYNYFGTGSGDFTYSVALGVAVNDKVAIYIEPYGDLVDFEEHVANFDAGFTYLVHKDLQLDFSFGTGLNHTMNYLSVGASWLIHKQKAEE